MTLHDCEKEWEAARMHKEKTAAVLVSAQENDNAAALHMENCRLRIRAHLLRLRVIAGGKDE